MNHAYSTWGAIFNGDRTYRYKLWRTWTDGQRKGTVLFVMLNPSTTEEGPETNDPTVRRCENFAHAWGYDKILVGNLYAYRSTDPKQLQRVRDPVGPENDYHLAEMCKDADLTIAAWGVNVMSIRRAPKVRELLTQHRPLHCIALTPRDKYPAHPLYQPQDLQPQLYMEQQRDVP